ncbi:ankyrin repeat protein [Xylona heveae TC161]|uniref:Ankyrin repeat protein n=1 Tax=Xylona heveae (strain CBS 132557 / TC161) TaxID=1328760 RepID=A0A165F8K3_XYLHT|nr:ankyrin repeat protein [Xylona heveae TC161]KZF20702.1 ankyrin repeat protein [Xylona heveae TC161]
MAAIQASHAPRTSSTPRFFQHYPPKEISSLADASAAGDLDTVRNILQSYIKCQSPEDSRLQEFWPVLLTALSYDRAEIVSYLLDAGIPLSSLHIQQAVRTKSADIFEVFLRHGWDINAPFSETQPSALAFIVEDWELTNWFLDHGADPNAACRLDLTPMSFAIQTAPLRTIHLLFDRGGDIGKGQLIHHAVERNDGYAVEVIQLLLQKGAVLNARMYENHPPSWNLQFFKGLGTALHRAAELGKSDVVSFLLQQGADISVRDSKGRTALDCARRYNRTNVVMILESS